MRAKTYAERTPVTRAIIEEEGGPERYWSENVYGEVEIPGTDEEVAALLEEGRRLAQAQARKPAREAPGEARPPPACTSAPAR